MCAAHAHARCSVTVCVVHACRKHAVMAHAPYLTDEDLALFRARGAGVAHCPLSNFYYANAAFPLRRVVDAGVAVGLGTDVGGAPSACMFQSCRDAVVASKALHEGVSPFTPFDVPPPVANAAITHGAMVCWLHWFRRHLRELTPARVFASHS